MRIVICASTIPFVWGGAEALVEGLRRQLIQRDIEVDVVGIPFMWYIKPDILKGYLAWRLLNLTESEGKRIDMVITTKFPSFAIEHPHKVTWLVQQFRQAYDMMGTPYTHLDEAKDAELIGAIRQMDTVTLKESRRLYCISDNVGRRLAHYNGLAADTLYPPPMHDGLYRNDGYGDYVLVVSRLNRTKRVDQIIQAMPYVHAGVKLLVVGRGDERNALETLSARLAVGDRVQFMGFVDDSQLLALYAGAMAVFYAPYDEDYGYATVEAFKSQKPVLTTTDAGGVLEFVEDDVTGYVASPNEPQQLAARINELHSDRMLCQRLGTAGHDRVQPITWDRTLHALIDG